MSADRKSVSEVPQNPWLQAGGLAFVALYGLAILAAISWLISNVREIPPQNRAVVIRLGALSQIRNAGLLLAFPRPIDEVTLVPSAETILEQDTVPEIPATGLSQSTQGNGGEDETSATTLSDAEAAVGNRLTGDAGVVLMDAKVYYSVVDPFEYVVQRSHLGPALQRLISRSIVWVCASRDVDAILVARPELVGVNNQLAAEREQLRHEVQDDINRRLARLRAAGAGLGIELRRVDLVARLHPDTVDAFDSVLTANQDALRETADAHTEGEQDLQSANGDADHTTETAQAEASERISKAQADTADVVQLSLALKSGSDPGLLQRLYRKRIAAVLAKTPNVTLVNPGDDAHLIIQGAVDAPAASTTTPDMN